MTIKIGDKYWNNAEQKGTGISRFNLILELTHKSLFSQYLVSKIILQSISILFYSTSVMLQLKQWNKMQEII